MTFPLSRLIVPIAAMVAVIVASNILVQYPLNDWLTWGAFTYPFAFLVTDLTNRAQGAASARRVAYAGFAVGVVLSVWLADARIALASGSAFLCGQLLDIAVFNRLRRASWWRAPLVSSVLASAVDTVLFFGLAFAGQDLPWITWAIGDFAVKLAFAAALLVPYRVLMNAVLPPRATPA